jgi:hypothetical protein
MSTESLVCSIDQARFERREAPYRRRTSVADSWRRTLEVGGCAFVSSWRNGKLASPTRSRAGAVLSVTLGTATFVRLVNLL